MRRHDTTVPAAADLTDPEEVERVVRAVGYVTGQVLGVNGASVLGR